MYGDDFQCWAPDQSPEVFDGVDLARGDREKVFSSNARRFWEFDKTSAATPELVSAL